MGSVLARNVMGMLSCVVPFDPKCIFVLIDQNNYDLSIIFSKKFFFALFESKNPF